MKDVGVVQVKVIKAEGLMAADVTGTSVQLVQLENFIFKILILFGCMIFTAKYSFLWIFFPFLHILATKSFLLESNVLDQDNVMYDYLLREKYIDLFF